MNVTEETMPFMKKTGAPKRWTRKITMAVGGKPTATAAGLMAAAAASVAAVRMARQKDNGTEFHVRADGDAGWILTRDREKDPIDRFDRKGKAVTAGRNLAKAARPSVLVVHGADGKVGRKHSYGAN
jgi:hypothetical protein